MLGSPKSIVMIQLIPHSQLLHAGSLTAEYDHGTLRYLKLGSVELLRMIYFALRDAQWGTLPLLIVEQDIEASADAFAVRYRAQNRQHGRVIVDWECQLTGQADGQVAFRIRGTFREAFRSNRAGFCVLHPLRGTRGQPFTVITPQGEEVNRQFPHPIAPHQPATNIQALRWTTADGTACALDFAGDTFEMEDQRNWTDASYKTYCTPLDRPFPVTYQPGDVVEQGVVFRVSSKATVTPEEDTVRIRWQETAVDWPTLGSCLSLDLTDPDSAAVHLLEQLPLDGLRADLAWGGPRWVEQWRRLRSLAERVNKPLHLVLHHSVGEVNSLFAELAAGTLPGTVEAISVLEKDQAVPSANFTERVVPLARTTFPGVKVGIGTAFYFTLLNRNQPDLARADFTFFANSAQVHAFDDASIVETIDGQAATVVSARQFAGSCPVRVSPVGLHARFNPDAAAPASDQLTYAFAPDERQDSWFAAGWMVGCLAALATAGAAHIDFFDALGERGLIPGKTPSPAYRALRRILAQPPQQVVSVASSHPLAVSALGLTRAAGRILYLVNHRSEPVTVALDAAISWSVTWHLGEPASASPAMSPDNQRALTIPAHHCVELTENPTS